ncbi:MAG: right-handed parallel beta-helix repeat-containing protein [Haloarculaceae archaeon]
MRREAARTVGRRELLRLGSAAAAASLAGCSLLGGGGNSPVPPPRVSTPRGDDLPAKGPTGTPYEHTVNLVADAGADPTGQSSIASTLKRRAGDDTLLYLPQGRYLLDEPVVLSGFSNLGIVGDGATIVPPDGYTRYLLVAGVPRQAASAFRFAGVAFDCTGARTAPRPLQASVETGLAVSDVTVHGRAQTVRFDVTDRDGRGVVERLRLPDGGATVGGLYPPGCFVGPITRGRLTFRDCRIEGFPNNGLYASGAKGPTDVIGGTYRNNDIANVRVSGDSLVRGVHVRNDASPADYRNMRGIMLRNGRSARVENATIELADVTDSDGAIVAEKLLRTATIENTEIRIDVDDVPAIWAKSPTRKLTANGPTHVACRNLFVTGAAADGSTVRVVDRHGCTFERVSISQSGVRRNGLHLIRSRDADIRQAWIDVTGRPLYLEQSDPRQADVCTGRDGIASCMDFLETLLSWSSL